MGKADYGNSYKLLSELKARRLHRVGALYLYIPVALVGLVVPVKADRIEQLMRDVHMAGLIGVDAVPGYVAGMHVVEQFIPCSLQIYADQPVALRERLDDRAVAIHLCAHGIVAVGDLSCSRAS